LLIVTPALYNEHISPDVADRINASSPMLASKEIFQRLTSVIAQADKYWTFCFYYCWG